MGDAPSKIGAGQLTSTLDPLTYVVGAPGTSEI